MKVIVAFQVNDRAQENEFDLDELNLNGDSTDEEIKNVALAALSEKSGVSLDASSYIVKRDGEVVHIVPSFEFGGK